MTLQYFDVLTKLGASPATKFVVPMELSGLLAGMAGSLSQSFANVNTVTTPGPLTAPMPPREDGAPPERPTTGYHPRRDWARLV
jgi:hypothetical protein